MVTAALAEPRVAADAPIAAVDDTDAAAAVANANAAANANASTPTPPSSWPTYLLQFIHRYLDMREAEAQACAALAGVPRDALPLEMPPASSAALPQQQQLGAEAEAEAMDSDKRSRNGGATFRTVRLPGPEAAAEILRRSMLVRVRRFFFVETGTF